jgi:hypothetical protein
MLMFCKHKNYTKLGISSKALMNVGILSVLTLYTGNAEGLFTLNA